MKQYRCLLGLAFLSIILFGCTDSHYSQQVPGQYSRAQCLALQQRLLNVNQSPTVNVHHATQHLAGNRYTTENYAQLSERYQHHCKSGLTRKTPFDAQEDTPLH